MKLINGERIELKQSEAAREHFSNPYNYTDAIIDQFEHDIYQKYLTKKDNIILDIGSNVGLFALHVLPYAKTLVCVEPTPEHMRINRQMIDDNYKGGKEIAAILHEESALSEFTGTAQFYWCGINTTMNSLQNRGDRSFPVQTITLIDLIEKYKLSRVDFCKIDIEGSEWGAVSVKTLSPVKDIVKKFFIELHPPNQESQAEFEKIFQAVGYKTERVIHDTLFCYK